MYVYNFAFYDDIYVKEELNNIIIITSKSLLSTILYWG